MKLKKLISAIATMSMISVSVFASNTVTVKPVDFGTGAEADKVTIEGTLDSKTAEEVTIIVAKPGVSMSGDIADENKLVYQDIVMADDSGSYTVDVILGTLADETGDYTVYVKTKKATPVTGTFHYATTTGVGGRDDAITAINGATATEIEANLNTYVDTFGLDGFEVLDVADDADVAAALEAENFAADDYEGVQTTIKESAVLSVYNNYDASKEGYILNADNTFKNADVMGLTDLPSDSNLHDVYNDTLNDAGKEAVIESLQNQSFANMDELTAQFMESTILNGILNTDVSGGDHISEILTTENALAIGNADLQAAVANYLTNSAIKSQINSELLENTEFISIADLATKINSAVTAAQETQTPPPSTGSTGGSGGGFSGPAASQGGANTGTGSEGGTGSTGGSGNGTFIDLPTDHWAEGDIMSLYYNGAISGYPDGTVKPNQIVKREEGLKMICEALDIYGTGITVEYSDVVVGAWYEPYVKIGVENGIINGIGDGLFGVGAGMSRQDLAVMLWRAAGSPAVEGTLNFTDAASISEYARMAILYMQELGAMGGYPDGSIRASKLISRAELSKLLNACVEGGI